MSACSLLAFPRFKSAFSLCLLTIGKDTVLEVSFPTDSDGFLSQECPSCGQRFKVVLGEGSEEPISYCPYCGFNGNDCWYTPEQVEHIQAVAANVAIAPELKKIERQLKQASKGFLKIDMKSDLQKPSPPP